MSKLGLPNEDRDALLAYIEASGDENAKTAVRTCRLVTVDFGEDRELCAAYDAVSDATFALLRARHACARMLVRKWEGVLSAEIQRREAERWVGVLAKVLGLVRSKPTFVPTPLPAYYVSSAPPVVGIDGTTPRVPVPEGWTYLGQVTGTWVFDVATIHGGLSFSVEGEEHTESHTIDAEFYRHSDGSGRDRENPLRSPHRDEGLALYDRHREARRG